jgi:hypothetical protein
MSRPRLDSANRNQRAPRRARAAAAGSAYARFYDLANDLGLLPEWTLVDRGEADIDGDASAQVTLEDRYHVARFSVSRDNWPDDPASQFSILAHEASHLILADLVVAAEQAAKMLAEPAQALAMENISRQEELLADRLARLIIERNTQEED